MSYQCIKDMSVGTNKILKGGIVESIRHDKLHGESDVKFNLDDVHFLVPTSLFEHFFIEVNNE